ncbi:uncharacterized protein LOC141685904 [Apium graveolens]|uniref:uncharacterized protein LOC141685904 n=1 Tax=Apium graveolens TaxID=4045 RepID=UPI003D7A3B45
MGSLCAVPIFGDLLKSSNPDFVFLSKTLSDKKDIKELANKFGFFDYFAVDKVGREGGLAIMWKRFVGCNVIDFSNNHIDVHIMEGSNVDWRLTCYYGFPERDRRQNAWHFLRGLVRYDSIPWCIVGDFNDMLCVTNKMGPYPHPQSLLDGFKATIDDCGLLEVDLKGGDYTWEKSKGKPNWVRERLDRAFADAKRKFPLYRIDGEGVKRYFEERQKLEDLLMHEELYWKQRAKAFWLTEGDTNSKYFHAAASKRKKLNHITHLVTGENEVVDSHDGMGRVVLDYFRSVFDGRNSGSV